MKSIAYTRPPAKGAMPDGSDDPGGVSIMHIAPGARRVAALIDGEGTRVPYDPPVPIERLVHLRDRTDLRIEWAETESEFIARIMAKDIPPGATNVTMIDPQSLPDRKHFRAAWDIKDGAVSIDMPKARDVHMSRIRAVRDKRLKELDLDYNRADEDGDTQRKRDVAATKKKLRDLPATFDLGKAKTPEQLLKLWPEELPPA